MADLGTGGALTYASGADFGQESGTLTLVDAAIGGAQNTAPEESP